MTESVAYCHYTIMSPGCLHLQFFIIILSINSSSFVPCISSCIPFALPEALHSCLVGYIILSSESIPVNAFHSVGIKQVMGVKFVTAYPISQSFTSFLLQVVSHFGMVSLICVSLRNVTRTGCSVLILFNQNLWTPSGPGEYQFSSFPNCFYFFFQSYC